MTNLRGLSTSPLRTAAAVTVLAALAMAGLVALSNRGNSADQLLEQLSNLQAIVDSRPELDAELQRLQAQARSITGAVPGENAALAAANMQNDVRAIMVRVAGDIRSSQNLPTINQEGFERIDIAYEISLPLIRLSELLYQLETHTPNLFLDRVDLETPQNVASRSDARAERVKIHLIIRGYRWKG